MADRWSSMKPVNELRVPVAVVAAVTVAARVAHAVVTAAKSNASSAVVQSELSAWPAVASNFPVRRQVQPSKNNSAKKTQQKKLRTLARHC